MTRSLTVLCLAVLCWAGFVAHVSGSGESPTSKKTCKFPPLRPVQLPPSESHGNMHVALTARHSPVVASVVENIPSWHPHRIKRQRFAIPNA